MLHKIHEIALMTLHDCLGVKKGEDIVIICDQERLEIADALAVVADKIEARASIFVITNMFRKTKTITNVLISPDLIEMFKRADVIILLLAKVHEETDFRKMILHLIRESPVRVANLPGVTTEIFVKTICPTDLDKTEKIGIDVARLFMKGEKVRVLSSLGTDLTFSLYGKKAYPEISSGWLLEPSTWGNLPGSEVYLPIVMGSAEGRIDVDGSFPSHILSHPIRFNIHSGRVDPNSIESNDKKAIELLRNIINKENGDILAEFGLGLNENIMNLTGIAVIDEKIYGTGHFALGDNFEFGGENRSPVHFDMVFWKPTVFIDDELIMKDGIFVYRKEYLKYNYKNFPGELYTDEIVIVNPLAKCKVEDGFLKQFWKGGANRLHIFQLGDSETSMLAARVWCAINHGGSSIATLAKKTGIHLNDIVKVIEFLMYHNILEKVEIEKEKIEIETKEDLVKYEVEVK